MLSIKAGQFRLSAPDSRDLTGLFGRRIAGSRTEPFMRRFSFCLAVAVVTFYPSITAASDEQPRYKTIELKHFTNAEGANVPEAFVASFESNLRAQLEKNNPGIKILDEGATMSDADAPDSAVVEGKFDKIDDSKMTCGPWLTVEISSYRMSDHQPIGSTKTGIHYEGSSKKDAEKAGASAGSNAADPIQKLLGLKHKSATMGVMGSLFGSKC
jgi:hypothetical protein